MRVVSRQRPKRTRDAPLIATSSRDASSQMSLPGDHPCNLRWRETGLAFASLSPELEALHVFRSVQYRLKSTKAREAI